MSKLFLVLQRSFSVSIFLFTVFTSVLTDECDRFAQCNGPIRFYEDLNCEPIYEKPGDCCAVRYDCSHLSNRSADKCYLNGREYDIDEEINEEDQPSSCDVGCFCRKGLKDEAEFECAVLDCPYVFHPIEEECYIEHSPNNCCGTKVCNRTEGDRFYCENEGKLYRDGQKFYPQKSPDLECYCMKGYRGVNIEPFCKKFSCGTELRRAWELRSNCAPVFHSSQRPQTSCSFAYRCQNDFDSVINSANELAEKNLETVSNEMTCKFGSMSINIGEELNQDTSLSSVCIKCVCEVPPTLTCQQSTECEISNSIDKRT